MLYCSIDVEMTGLDIDRHDVLEFAAVLDDLSELDNPTPVNDLPVFHCVFPQEDGNYVGSAQALAMHSKLLTRINKKSRPAEDSRDNYVYHQFINKYSMAHDTTRVADSFGFTFAEWLLEHNAYRSGRKVHLNVAGKNFATSDLPFLQKHTNINDHVKIRQRILDPAILFYQEGDTALPTLSECQERLGFDSHVSHTAVDDARSVVRIIRCGMKLLLERQQVLELVE